MKKILVTVFLFPLLCNAQDTAYYNRGKAVLVQKLADISDSLQKSASPWRIATLQDLKKIQEKAVGKVANGEMGFVGVIWVSPVTRVKSPMGDYIDASYCFISNTIFKNFADQGSSASVLFVRE